MYPHHVAPHARLRHHHTQTSGQYRGSHHSQSREALYSLIGRIVVIKMLLTYLLYKWEIPTVSSCRTHLCQSHEHLATGPKEFATGLLFVGATRTKTFEGLAFHPGGDSLENVELYKLLNFLLYILTIENNRQAVHTMITIHFSKKRHGQMTFLLNRCPDAKFSSISVSPVSYIVRGGSVSKMSS